MPTFTPFNLQVFPLANQKCHKADMVLCYRLPEVLGYHQGLAYKQAFHEGQKLLLHNIWSRSLGFLRHSAVLGV